MKLKLEYFLIFKSSSSQGKESNVRSVLAGVCSSFAFDPRAPVWVLDLRAGNTVQLKLLACGRSPNSGFW